MHVTVHGHGHGRKDSRLRLTLPPQLQLRKQTPPRRAPLRTVYSRSGKKYTHGISRKARAHAAQRSNKHVRAQQAQQTQVHQTQLQQHQDSRCNHQRIQKGGRRQWQEDREPTIATVHTTTMPAAAAATTHADNIDIPTDGDHDPNHPNAQPRHQLQPALLQLATLPRPYSKQAVTKAVPTGNSRGRGGLANIGALLPAVPLPITIARKTRSVGMDNIFGGTSPELALAKQMRAHYQGWRQQTPTEKSRNERKWGKGRTGPSHIYADCRIHCRLDSHAHRLGALAA